MKNLILPVILFFSISSFGQPLAAKIYLIDQSEFNGYADISKKEKIEFRIDLNDEPTVFDEFDLKRIEFKDSENVFEYVLVEKKFHLLKVISEGAVIVYAKESESFSTQKTERELAKEDYINREYFSDAFNKVGSYRVKWRDGNTYTFYEHPLSSDITIFFLKRKSDNSAENIKLGFKKKAISFFKDCPYLVEIIENKEWKYQDMPKIVEYYNEMCAL